MVSGILEEMNLEEVRAFAPETALLGVASTEPHGPCPTARTSFSATPCAGGQSGKPTTGEPAC